MARPDSWFRFHNATLDNPKAQRLPGELFKAWINLLCLASRHGGKLPGNADVAFALRMDETAAETLLETLRARELLELRAGKVYAPRDWDVWQFKSDNSTDRVKKCRERKMKTNVAGNVSSNVSETPQTRPDQTIADTTPVAPKGAGRYSPDFESFWTLYPRKIGKDAAFRVWQRREKARELPALETLVEAIGRYISAKPADIDYCHPSTWLHGGRWQDDHATPTAPPAVITAPATLSLDEWRSAVRHYQQTDQWPINLGPQPGYGGCRVPQIIIAEFNLDGMTPPDFLRKTA